jgi:hypothetical protein
MKCTVNEVTAENCTTTTRNLFRLRFERFSSQPRKTDGAYPRIDKSLADKEIQRPRTPSPRPQATEHYSRVLGANASVSSSHWRIADGPRDERRRSEETLPAMPGGMYSARRSKTPGRRSNKTHGSWEVL